MTNTNSNVNPDLLAYIEKSDRDRDAWQASMEKSQKESNRKWEESNLKTDKMLDTIQDLMHKYGGLTNNEGEEVEKIFSDSFAANNLRLNGIQFDRMETNIKLCNKVELDIVLFNTQYIAIMEIKRKLREGDIKKFFKQTLETLEDNMPPKWQGKQIIPVLGTHLISKNIKERLSDIDCLVISVDDNRNLRILQNPGNI